MRRAMPCPAAAKRQKGEAEGLAEEAALRAILSRRWRTLPCGKPPDGFRVVSQILRSLLFDFSPLAAKFVASHAHK
jgi:hypothetical protein